MNFYILTCGISLISMILEALKSEMLENDCDNRFNGVPQPELSFREWIRGLKINLRDPLWS